MSAKLKAAQRARTNSTGLKNLRKEGRLPGIIMGKGKDNTMIHISSRDFFHWSKIGAADVVNLDIEGKGTIPVKLESVQRDTVTGDFIHVDFLRVDSN